jgi:lysophospholipase L1-like esterase
MITRDSAGRLLAALAILLFSAMLPARAASPDMLQRGKDLAARLQQGQPVTVVAFGDSLTDGMGTDGRHTFPRLFVDCLAYRFARSRIHLVVHGHPGATTGDALGWVQDEVIREKPDLALVQFGGNDKGWGRPLRDFRADFTRLLSEVAAQTQALVIACLNPIIDDDPNNAWSETGREVAAAVGVPAADLDAAIRRGDHDFRGPFPWTAHPGDFTHVIMAREVLRAFDEGTGTAPAFNCGLMGESTVSAAPTYDLRARLHNLTDAPLDCTVKLDYPDEQHEETVRLQAGGGEVCHAPIALRRPLPPRSYSVPVHLWARSPGYGSFDARWLVVAPAVAATPANANGEATGDVNWLRFGAESLMFGSHLWLGLQDLGGRFAVLALPDRLRFDLRVADDDITVTDLNDPSRGDSVELYLDLRGDRDQGKPVYSEDVLLLQILAPTASDQPAQWHGMQPLPADLATIAVATQRTEGGYNVQVDVPLAPIQARRGKNWGGLGFDVGINDADFGGYRKSQMMWAGMPDNYLNAAYFAGLYRDKLPEGATRRTLR